jgi:hypothetical protein
MRSWMSSLAGMARMSEPLFFLCEIAKWSCKSGGGNSIWNRVSIHLSAELQGAGLRDIGDAVVDNRSTDLLIPL